MNVTRRTILKAVKDLSLNPANFEIVGNSIITILENTRKGNREAKKVAKHLINLGANCYSTSTGWGAELYRFERWTHSHELAMLNIN